MAVLILRDSDREQLLDFEGEELRSEFAANWRPDQIYSKKRLVKDPEEEIKKIDAGEYVLMIILINICYY